MSLQTSYAARHAFQPRFVSSDWWLQQGAMELREHILTRANLYQPEMVQDTCAAALYERVIALVALSRQLDLKWVPPFSAESARYQFDEHTALLLDYASDGMRSAIEVSVEYAAERSLLAVETTLMLGTGVGVPMLWIDGIEPLEEDPWRFFGGDFSSELYLFFRRSEDVNPLVGAPISPLYASSFGRPAAMNLVHLYADADRGHDAALTLLGCSSDVDLEDGISEDEGWMRLSEWSEDTDGDALHTLHSLLTDPEAFPTVAVFDPVPQVVEDCGVQTHSSWTLAEALAHESGVGSMARVVHIPWTTQLELLAYDEGSAACPPNSLKVAFPSWYLERANKQNTLIAGPDMTPYMETGARIDEAVRDLLEKELIGLALLDPYYEAYQLEIQRIRSEDIRRRRYELFQSIQARKPDPEYEELFALMDEQIGTLKAENERLSSALDTIQYDWSTAQANLAALSTWRSAHLDRSGERQPLEVQAPRSLKEVVARAATLPHIFVCDSAEESARDVVRPQACEKALLALQAISDFAAESFSSSGSVIPEEWFRHRGFKYAAQESESTRNKFGEARRCRCGNDDVRMETHLTFGQGAPEGCVQIYFDLVPESQVARIGYIGRHKRTSTDSFNH